MKFIDGIFAALTCMICSFLIMAQERTFQDMLDKFDSNCNMMLERNELPCRMWHKIGSRDLNDDGIVDRREYDGIIGWLTPQ
jgi:hypothetical protein